MALPPFTIVDVQENEPTPPSGQPGAPAGVPPAPIDPGLAQGALARIRKQVQGNGLKPSSVELRGIYGQIHTFYATTSVLLSPAVQEGRRAGRFTDGQIIQPHQAEAAIGEFVARMEGDRGVLGLVHETVLSRPDQGFGLAGEIIPLPQVGRVFVAHEACGKCRGMGGTPCHNCHGQMRIACYRCHGNGGVPCVTCQGRGQILTPQGPIMCNACAGRGLSACPVCQGQRFITCPECQGYGKKICESCGGQGWTTRTWAVTLSARTGFKLRTDTLPPALVSLIERVGGGRLSADGHARVVPVLGREAEGLAREADIEAGASLWFLYRADMPFAELDITMGRGSIRPRLAGYKARLLDVPDFMDTLLAPGAKALAQGAQGGAAATQRILESARYRALGDTLRGLIRMPGKRVHKMLMDTYTLGLTDAFARRIIKDANAALSRLSLWPRTVAMALSLVISFGCLAAFYLYGGREALVAWALPAGAPRALGFLADIGFALLLGMAGIYAIRFTARRASRTVLEGLGVVSGGQMPMPRPGAPGLWLWLGIVVMLAGFAFVSGLLALI